MRGRRIALAGVLCVLTVAVLAIASGPAVANESPTGADAVFAFPSANSQVVGSVGFIDDDEVGFFWSVARGDSVTQTFNGPATLHKAVLKIQVVNNVLNGGNHVDWSWEINNVQVGTFSVAQGFTGVVKKVATGLNLTRPYTVKIRVTNEVPGGGGSHTLAYAGNWAHLIRLRG